MTKPDLMAELAACPFCGSAARRGEHDIPAVQCSNDACGASLHRYHREEAYALWNRRTHHAELEAAVRKAARYDWLKDMENAADVGVFGSIGRPDLDEAIDREMAYQNNSAREG